MWKLKISFVLCQIVGLLCGSAVVLAQLDQSTLGHGGFGDRHQQQQHRNARPGPGGKREIMNTEVSNLHICPPRSGDFAFGVHPHCSFTSLNSTVTITKCFFAVKRWSGISEYHCNVIHAQNSLRFLYANRIAKYASFWRWNSNLTSSDQWRDA